MYVSAIRKIIAHVKHKAVSVECVGANLPFKKL